MFLLAKVIFFALNDSFQEQYMMKFQQRTSAILFVLLSIFLTSGLHAQSKVAVELDDPIFEELKSPEFGGNDSKKWDAKDWLEIEVEFEITNILPKDSKFVDNLTVKWYVAATDPDSKGKRYILLEKVVEHINVPVGEKVVTSVYLAPSAVLRLSGGDRAGEKVIETVGGEILFNGQKVAQFSSKGKVGSTPWWQSPNLSRYDKIPLRSKNETPFHYFWWDRYAENKVERR